MTTTESAGKGRKERTASDPEPVLPVDEIQGNIVPGFLKPYMEILAVRVDDVARFRPWLSELAGQVTTTREAMETRGEIRRLRADTANARAHAVPDDLDDLWLAVAVSYQAMMEKIFKSTNTDKDGKDWDEDNKARRDELETFSDDAFRMGLAKRSASLGDPVSGPYAPDSWKLGGPENSADLLLIVAADQEVSLQARIATLEQDVHDHGATVTWRERGTKLKNGNEHFGFKDGVSQPGVRGRYDDGEDSYLTERTVSPDEVPENQLYGLPGQPLVWPGEFVFGLPASSADPLVAGNPRGEGPWWSKNGSYLVFRRLRQDVAGFDRFVKEQAAQMAQQPAFADWTHERLAAALIGRWPSGAPVSRTPKEENTKIGEARWINDNFLLGADAPILKLVPNKDNTYPDDFRVAESDPVGFTCPLVAHIRKVNTRLSPSDAGGNRSTYTRRILRRGLPYGDKSAEDKGLHFLSYQASIEDQFEFLLTQWTNDPTNPRSPSGHDLLIGQNGQPGQNRVREGVILSLSGDVATITATEQYVNPTGGGYFFAPSISTLRDVLGRPETAPPPASSP